RLGPDEEHEIRRGDDAIRALARISADHAHRKRMRAGNLILAVQRCGDRNLELLGECNQFASRTRRAHTSAGNDHRLLRALEERQRGAHTRSIRLGAEWWDFRKLRLAQKLHIGLFLVDLALVAAKLQMDR